jgi:YYY domain-containing protein
MSTAKSNPLLERRHFAILALTFILLIAGYLRLTGLNWDADQHLHPDERFLTLVETSIASVESWGDYFDTANSTLNPNNRGYGFFVYGTFPIFLVRYAAEWIGQTGIDQIQLVGRALSAMADLGVVFVVYLIGTALYNRRVGLLGAAFSALTVAQIQQSHYLTVDNFTNFFTYFAVLFAVRIAVRETPKEEQDRNLPATWVLNPVDFALFGVGLGMAVASKVSSAPLALLLPLAVLIAWMRKSNEERTELIRPILGYTALAALLSLLVFRILQPYSFSGPGFLNIGLNEHWVETMRQLAGQVSGDVDWPPSMQWARRSLLFGLQNMVQWGMGLPLALIAWGGFIWMGRSLYRRNWLRPELVVWAWGLAYFAWQSLAFNPTMRYFLPAYPALALFGAVAVLRLWEWGGERPKKNDPRIKQYATPFAKALLGIVLISSAIWAFAFVQIYRNPITRMEASRWIYQNVPGPITLGISQADGVFRQPLAVPYNYEISDATPYFTNLRVKESGMLSEIQLYRLIAPLQIQLHLQIGEISEMLIAKNENINWAALNSDIGQFMVPLSLDRPGDYRLQMILPAGSGLLHVESAILSHNENEGFLPIVLAPESEIVQMGEQLAISFLIEDGLYPNQIELHLQAETEIALAALPIELRIASDPEMNNLIASFNQIIDPIFDSSALTQVHSFQLENPFQVEANQDLYLEINVVSQRPLQLLGAAVGNESSWDDGLPRRMDGYDGFGGIYQGLNFELYWEENQRKLDRFSDVMDGADYLFISSSRQWASLPRIPERFPLTTHYYRELLGCSADFSIEVCFNQAELDDFAGNLGFELVGVYTSNPNLGSFEINDQGSEEAFTVYDHPKVFLFQKSENYDRDSVRDILGQVDLSAVQYVTPKQATGPVAATLILPVERWEQQQAGGTWSDLFNVDSIINASPWISLLAWYVVLSVFSWAIFPLIRKALPGLADQGFPFVRISFLLLLSYLSWLGASMGLTFSRGWLAIFAMLLVSVGLYFGYRQREELLLWWQENRREIIRVELLFLAFFSIMLLIRIGNPDLWHPGKGGEKPMDFAYFNAVLKSTSFPAFDPWFAGGYINYYYYGFVLVGSLTKLLGIIPAVAYNLILPTLFAMLAMGAYSVVWNLLEYSRGRKRKYVSPHMGGLLAASSMVLLSNLGSLQMIFHGFQRMGAQGAYDLEPSLLSKIIWAAQGFIKSVAGERLPFGLGDWYWNPTRIIPAPGETQPITEFPLFTFTYADLHAHMIALPITLLIIAWALSIIVSKVHKSEKQRGWLIWSFLLAAITIGSLRPTNTWDFPTYLVLASLACFYAFWRYWPKRKGEAWKPVGFGIGAAALLASLSFLAYQPYADWYRQGFTSMEFWQGTHTPLGTYFIHWGIFLFFMIFWMLWETRQWLAQTPLSSVRKLEPYRYLISIGFALLLAVILILNQFEIAIGWFALLMMLWSAMLILRPSQPETKRLVLFLIGTGLFITLLVEIVRLQGDISRMNTVFKFYMQVWVLFGISSAAAVMWSLQEFNQWARSWQRIWRIMGVSLVVAGLIFIPLGVGAKIQDRMTADGPLGLDGLAYMPHALYYDRDQELQLEQDYTAIRWLQDNVQGSPVIVEVHTGEYRWGSRYSINTGLPAVLGWNWHQRQQREFVPGNDIWGRAADIDTFYGSEDVKLAVNFLQKYDVQYIIVGQLEEAYYPDGSLDKFAQFDGTLWEQVFEYKDTHIYLVNPSALIAYQSLQ